MWAYLQSGSAGREYACNVGDLGSIPRLGRSPGEGKGWLLTPEFWPGEFHGLYSPWSRKELDVTERLSLSSIEPYRAINSWTSYLSSNLSREITWKTKWIILRRKQGQELCFGCIFDPSSCDPRWWVNLQWLHFLKIFLAALGLHCCKRAFSNYGK